MYREQGLNAAGFEHVAWTGGGIEEDDLVRLIVACKKVLLSSVGEKAQTTMETVTFKHVDRIPLHADIYYLEEIQKTRSKRPTGKLISLEC